MKKKTPPVSPEEAREARFDRFWLICIVCAAVLWLIHYTFADRVLYRSFYTPIVLCLCSVAVGMLCIYWIRRRFFSMKAGMRVYFADFTANVKNLFLAVTVFGLIGSWGFTLVNGWYISGRPLSRARCPVVQLKLSRSAGSNSVDFSLSGRNYTFNNFSTTSEMQRVASGSAKGLVDLQYREGLLGSYVIYTWDFSLTQ